MFTSVYPTVNTLDFVTSVIMFIFMTHDYTINSHNSGPATGRVAGTSPSEFGPLISTRSIVPKSTVSDNRIAIFRRPENRP